MRKGEKIYPLAFIGGYNITLKLQNEQILLSADFRSLDGKKVAEIIDNEWHINFNNYFDRNYDENGLEVIDQDGITKFQIDFTDIYNIRLGGSFIAGGSLCTFHDDGRTFVIGLKTYDIEELLKISSKIETMFLYPADNHFGVRKAPKNADSEPVITKHASLMFEPRAGLNFYGHLSRSDSTDIAKQTQLPDSLEAVGISFGARLYNNGWLPL